MLAHRGPRQLHRRQLLVQRRQQPAGILAARAGPAVAVAGGLGLGGSAAARCHRLLNTSARPGRPSQRSSVSSASFDPSLFMATSIRSPTAGQIAPGPDGHFDLATVDLQLHRRTLHAVCSVSPVFAEATILAVARRRCGTARGRPRSRSRPAGSCPSEPRDSTSKMPPLHPRGTLGSGGSQRSVAGAPPSPRTTSIVVEARPGA